MEQKNFSVIILAAGKGTRMKSALPKVLHPVAGDPMIRRVIQSVRAAGAEDIRVVVGFGEKLVRQVVEPLGCTCHVQSHQLGTADAVRSADPTTLRGVTLILNGDHPLIETTDILQIVKEFEMGSTDLSVVSATVKNPGDFGRIIRHKGELKAIVESCDASVETLKINEINTGIYIMTSSVLKNYLSHISNNNRKQEYYLTDLIGICQENHVPIGIIQGARHISFGVNTQGHLAKAGQLIFRRKMRKVLEEGVVVIDPKSTYIEDSVQIGPSSVIYPGAYLRGHTRIGSFCVIEPNCYIMSSQIADSVQIRAGSYLEDAQVSKKAIVGPYARLRPGSELGEEVQIGNFVECKNTKVGAHSKAAHLTYLGDTDIGTHTNIGCGTITCNYQANRKKYRTRIGDHVFVGSDSQFIAPVEVGDHAIIGSGSTITKNVPNGALAVTRGKQVTKEGYAKKYQKTEE